MVVISAIQAFSLNAHKAPFETLKAAVDGQKSR